MYVIRIKIHQFTRTLLFSLYAIIAFGHSFYGEGSILTRGSTILILIICSYYLIKTIPLKKKKPLFFNAWTAFLLLNVTCFILTASYTDKYHYGMFLGVLMTLLSFYPFFYFSSRGLLRSKHLKIFFFVMLPITILGFYTLQFRVLNERLVTDSTNLVNNISYNFVSLMPLAFLVKKKLISASLMGILMVFVIQGAKRGALIAGGIMVVGYFLYLIKTDSKKNKLKTIMTALGFIPVLTYIGYKYYFANEYLVSRMLAISQGGSGRDIIYTTIFNQWYYSNDIVNYFLGFGFASSLKLTNGFYAHNDWLELLSNIGLLGVMFYGLLYLSGLKLFFSKTLYIDKKILFLSVLLVWIFISIVSMWYTNSNSYIYSILIAYLGYQHTDGQFGSVKETLSAYASHKEDIPQTLFYEVSQLKK